MLIYVQGELLDSINHPKFKQTKSIIVHGVNCQGVMGKGVALSVKVKLPYVFNEYRKLVFSVNNKKDLLGSIQEVTIKNSNFTIINAFTQFYYGKYHDELDYNIVSKIFQKINNLTFDYLHIPKIGSSLGKGSWDIINDIIEKEIPNKEIFVWEIN